MVSVSPVVLLAYLHLNVGYSGLLATALPTPDCQLRPCCVPSSPQLPVSAPPTSLDECFFFNSLVVGLPHSLVFWKFWLFFVFKLIVTLWVVRGSKAYLPTPPSWPELPLLYILYLCQDILSLEHNGSDTILIACNPPGAQRLNWLQASWSLGRSNHTFQLLSTCINH